MSKTAALAAVLVFLGAGYWFLSRPAPTVATAPGAPAGGAAGSGFSTDTSKHTHIFTSKITAEPAPALPAPMPPVGFQQKLDAAQASLPTAEELRKLKPEEQHKTPAQLFAAGTRIGKIAEAIEKDPSLAPQGLEFYGKCARRGELSTSVRALCLGNLRDLAKASGRPTDEDGVSPEIRRLADKLNEK